MYLTILALACPFKRPEELYLACLSNLLLTCCFISGIAIKLCEEGEWNETCEQYLGLSGQYKTTLFVVILTGVMLAVSVFVIIGRAVTTITAPIIRVVWYNQELNLELMASLNFHCFLSHAWGTGQDQTHTVMCQMQ